MPRVRWVTYDGRDWRLTDLARAHGLAPGTLSARLDRGVPVDRAVRDAPLDATASARLGRALNRAFRP